MNIKIKNIIRAANLAYSEGNFYSLSEDELSTVNRILNLDLTNVELVDSVYDIIYNKAKELWPDDKFFKELQAENAGYGKEIIHSEPMGSMEELKEGDWDTWKCGHKHFLQSDKLDGCSIILTYKDSKLYSAATRGRGIKGKDIMRHIPFISNIPQEISYNDTLVVRGELVCPKIEISQMLKQVAEIEGKEQKNGRNTIAGALNRKESNEIIFGHAHFVAYWNSVKRGNALYELQDLGFEIPHCVEITDVMTEENLITTVKERIEQSKYEIDGIILTQLDNPEDGFVSGTINPRASRKFKMGIYDNKAESVITNITWQPSKSGKLTPVLNIEPIELCGSTISNVTGHNYQNLVDKCCGIGSKVIIKRAGLVIPYLEEVLTTSDDLNLPQNIYQEGVDIYLKDKNIKEVIIQLLVHFVETLGIDQAGEASLEKLLISFPQIENPLFLLHLEQPAFTFTLGVNGNKLYNSIQSVLNEGITESRLADACGAFGSGLGESLLLQIEQTYGKLVILDKEIANFGPNRMKQYNDNYSNWLSIVSLYKSFGYTFKSNQKKTDLLLSDKVICFSGVRDKDLAKTLEELGATITETFSKKVNLLVVKDENTTTSKTKKAKEQGCQIISLLALKENYKNL